MHEETYVENEHIYGEILKGSGGTCLQNVSKVAPDQFSLLVSKFEGSW
jgi:hypothetical protein